jgi:hypothetical protein
MEGSQVWWHTPLIWRLRKEDQKFQANLGSVRPCLKKTKNKPSALRRIYEKW